MNDFATVLVILSLPSAAIVFLSLVWARGRLRIGLTASVFVVPLLIFLYVLLTPSRSGGDLSGLGFLILAAMLLGGGLVGAILGAVVILLRHRRAKQAPPQSDIP